MPIVPLRARNSLYELQEFCKEQKDNCSECALKYQCVFLWRGNRFCDLEHPKQSDIVYGCRETETCSEYILMHANMSRKLSDVEKQYQKALMENELLKAEKDALISMLDRLCPDWKNKTGGLK